MIKFSDQYLSYSEKEPIRFQRDRVSQVVDGFHGITAFQAEEYLLSVWLELGTDFNDEPFSYESYLHKFQQKIDALVESGDRKLLLDTIALLKEFHTIS